MSPALNGSSAIRRFEGSDAIEIRDGITFDFYTGLPHICLYNLMVHTADISDLGWRVLSMVAMWSITVWMGWVVSWSPSGSRRITVTGSSSDTSAGGG